MEDERIKDLFVCLGENLGERRERIAPENCFELLKIIFLQFWGLGIFIYFFGGCSAFG